MASGKQLRTGTFSLIAALGLVVGMLALLPAAAQAGGPPVIAWSPSTSGSFDYGPIYPGHTASQTFTLTNSGSSGTGMLTAALSGSAAFAITSDVCTGTSLGPKKSCTVTVGFAPAETGKSGTATLAASSKKPAASASLTLTGPPNLQLSPGTFNGRSPNGEKNYAYDFGPVASATQTFTVTNVGNGTTTTLLYLAGGSPEFVLANDTCENNALAPNATCSFDYTFTAPADCLPGYRFDNHLLFFKGFPGDYVALFARGSCL